jgi:hypothetical protein
MIAKVGIPTILVGLCLGSGAQVIEYETQGIKHQTLTRGGVTIMFATTRAHVHDYAMLQVSVSNGAQIYSSIHAQDFSFQRADGHVLRAELPDEVVKMLLDRATPADVQKLVVAYENNLYGIPNMRTLNGYEQRRRNAFAEGVSGKFKAAAAASALTLVNTRLAPGQSTDGAVFFHMDPKFLLGGKLLVRTQNDSWEFNNIQ